EGGGDHALDGALLAVGQLDPDALRRWRWITGGRFRWVSGVAARPVRVPSGRIRVYRFPIPLRVAEMLVGFHEVVDGEVVLPVVQPRTPADDLLELDHRVDGPHQNDVADVARVYPGGE